MRFVLVTLTLNHFIYLYFENFIQGVMNNASMWYWSPFLLTLFLILDIGY
ncbi:hypothetical protein D047_2023 [Vibrio parahaemolyticus VPTS-2010_2]|nr:hypothetical protein D047_2023 [Vibrio parahaemolyticus VPTS-2010_2]